MYKKQILSVIFCLVLLLPAISYGNLINSGLIQHAQAASNQALCIANISCDPISDSILTSRGYLVTTLATIPSDLSPYNVVILDDIGSGFINLDKLKSYVNGGGGVVFLSGTAYYLQFQDHSWLGFSGAGYTGNGESASIIVNHPLGTSLLAGDILKQQAPDEHGAQFVTGVSGTVVAKYGGGQIYGYYTNYGSGRVYYQADINPSIAGQEAVNNIRTLLTGGISFAKIPSTFTPNFVLINVVIHNVKPSTGPLNMNVTLLSDHTLVPVVWQIKNINSPKNWEIIPFLFNNIKTDIGQFSVCATETANGDLNSCTVYPLTGHLVNVVYNVP